MLLYVVVCFLLLLLIKFLISKRPNYNKGNRRQPPSPAKLPIIGNLHQLGSLPHRSLAFLSRKHGPLMLVHFGSVPNLVVSSEKMAKEVMKTHDINFSDRPSSITTDELLYHAKDMVFSHYGDYWRQLRKISVVHLLSANRVESYQKVREDEVSLIIQNISRAQGPIDIGEIAMSTTNGIISRVAFGKKYYEENENGSKFHRLLSDLSTLIGTTPIADIYPMFSWLEKLNGFDARLKKCFQEWDEFLDMVVEEHLNACRTMAPGDDNKDFVDILIDIDSKDEGSFNLGRDGIKALLLDTFVAGTETIHITIVWLMAELIRKPRILSKVQEEIRNVINGRDQLTRDDIEKMNYLKAVVKETLRLHPPAPMLVPRQSIQPVQIQKYYIRAKTRVLINSWAIGRDPESWEAPDEFWPERFIDSSSKSCCVDFRGQDFQFIPFGAGRRSCPGISYAATTMEYVLANLLHWFDWELAPGITEVDMDEAGGIIVRKKNPLLLIAKEHFK